MAKDFFNVGKMSQDYTGLRQGILADIVSFGDEQKERERKTRVHLKILLVQTDIQLAIAQQLTMIAQHLGEIVAKSKPDTDV